jgi:hypothetical protein
VLLYQVFEKGFQVFVEVDVFLDAGFSFTLLPMNYCLHFPVSLFFFLIGTFE